MSELVAICMGMLIGMLVFIGGMEYHKGEKK